MPKYAEVYTENEVLTASRGELLLLTYRGVLRCLREAGEAMRKHDLEAQQAAIVKAQNLLLHLADTLDHSVHPQLCANLARIYWYAVDRLTRANLEDDWQGVAEVRGLISRLLSAWEEASGAAGVPSAPESTNRE